MLKKLMDKLFTKEDSRQIIALILTSLLVFCHYLSRTLSGNAVTEDLIGLMMFAMIPIFLILNYLLERMCGQ